MRWLQAIFCLIVLSCSEPAFTQPAASTPPTQIPGHDAVLLGTAWYPEQWPESRWDEDLRLMEAADIKVVRITEFAWSRMEPSEGHYDFEWLDRAIALAAKHHIVSVLGTPTATPPAWLTLKHPEILRVEPDGQRVTHGNRAHASAASVIYRDYCRKIAEQLAQRYGKNPSVVGWQIDNEYGYALMSYDDETRGQFRQWLKAKYGTLKNLNTRWTTAYWSQTYDDWNEIPIPAGPHNPGLMLEWKHFITTTWTDYQQNQITVLRQHIEPRQFITGNFMGFFDGFDHYTITEPLTFASWDDYVGTGHLDPIQNGLSHDLTRGFKRENFWVMETQPGMVNWSKLNNALNKGEVRAMAWQAIAHGADEVGYWQWRTALNGQEEYHGTLVGVDGTPVPLYEEASEIGHEFAATQDAFQGTSPESEVALFYSYDSHWAIQWQKHNQQYDDIALLKSYYGAIRKLSQSVDVVSANTPLQNYKLVVAPSLNVLPQDVAAHLLEYAHNGGHLVLGPRSGMKDEFNGLLAQRQPGYLAEALGGRVEQFYALEQNVPVSGAWGQGEASVWAEQLKSMSPETKTLLSYGKGNGWLDDQPAALTRVYGKGSITYIAAVLDEKLMAAAAEWMVHDSGVKAVFGPVPEGVEVSRRRGLGKDVFILINTSQEIQHVTLPHSMQLLLGKKEAGAVTLPPYGVEVLLDAKP
jgi:beta-galactosidase